MTEGFKRVEQECREFCDLVAYCRGEASGMAHIKDAYSRLNRAHDRYEYEAQQRSLDPSEHSALSKVFGKDEFIKTMLTVRIIGDHVLKRGGADLLNQDNERFTVTSASSAAAVFSHPRVYLEAADGPHLWDHLKELGEAARRISTAITNAKRAA